ncbi:Uncharacterized conserved protein YkwD, contains CAP (CSP/antigen 5/PR1) domain [Nakamurella panacisegetis]|uniref:Uncharacterized conserved protein YkwD, contains CAP (CSP/antigen 5/PR1) domain n=1 Tax=Nakamurella panacisegetis TaxID=1090615 RepID=A0A1H0IN39_9ACTN|nr:Uncharacterized conserved protein YkwD, contains CAP (CSP/antigen 5/PR1) domain [Nakamurella panacisegetis]
MLSRFVRPVSVGLAIGLAVSVASAPSAGASTVVWAPVATAVPVPSAPSLAVVAPVTTALSPSDQLVLSSLNTQRSAAGLGTLTEVKGIDTESMNWSRSMATAGQLSHDALASTELPTSGAPAATVYGENVASWVDSTVDGSALVAKYLTNATNSANILNPAFKYVGIGTATAADGSNWSTTTFVDSADPTQTYDPALQSIPVGQLNSATLVGSTVQVTGWGYDLDTATSPIQVQLTDTAPSGVVTSSTVTAGTTRTDVTQLTATTGTSHGFTATMPVSGRGVHQICATLVNAGAGSTNPALGCLPVEVTGPYGSLDTADVTSTAVTVTGWAVDPDAPSSATTVTLTDQNAQGTVTLPTVTADQADPNVDAAIPGVGSGHGFVSTFSSQVPGAHTVCATTSSVAAPTLTKALGCRTFSVRYPAAGAIGVVSSTTSSLTVNGWALDPNVVSQSSMVQVTVTSPSGQVITPALLTAGGVSADSLVQFPSAGSSHGFGVTVPTTEFGVYRVCAVANSLVDPSASTSLPCQSATITNLQGWFDSATVVSGSIRVRGWGLDPAHLTTSVPAWVTVTGPSGTKTQALATNVSRPDIGTAYPGAGNLHGFDSTVPSAGVGVNKVCVTEQAVGNSTTRMFPCINVTV